MLKKASQMFNAFTRIAFYMDQKKRRIIMKTHINSQFGCCPLVWMMHCRTLIKKIKRMHEKALRIVYQDDTSTFEKLLNKHNSMKMHTRNLLKFKVKT